ncbi:MAG: Rne/Rng family ribonuclease [Pseudomonadota bacterium]
MLIDATHPEETRVVVVDGNKVDDFDFESTAKRQLAGNIYLAKVTRVEPSLQAAFVDYGGNRHGFLAFSEIHPDYYQIPVADREALLAEEAEAARSEADDDTETEDKPRKSRRSRGGRRSKSADAQDAKDEGGDKAERSNKAEVAGLEVISLAGEGDENAQQDVPASLAVLDNGEAPEDAPAATEPSPEEPTSDEMTAEPAETPAAEEAETDTSTIAPETVEADASDAEAPDETTVAGTDGEGTPAEAGQDPSSDTPRTIAEDTGLDGEKISEEIPEDSRQKPGEPAETEAVQEAEAPEAMEAESGEPAADAAEATPAEPASDKGAAEPPSTDAAPTEDSAEASDDDTSSESGDGETAKPRKRQRRSRRKKDTAADDINGAQEANGTDQDAESEEVESVGAEDLQEEVARARSARRRRYKIQDVVKVRQIMLVQVVKEERGNKGAALTTYLSLAGRYCVLMPNTARGGGISRKITNVSDRKRLREIVDELEVPKGMGLIVRTAGAERTRPEIKRDYEFLSRQWESVRELTLKSIAPTLIYEEGSLIKRSIRDLYSKEIDTVMVEGPDGYREAKDYMKMLMPSHAKNVQQYGDPVPLYARYQVESYLNGMFSPTVQLKSGGYIVIGVTEALVAVDVNSGRATKQGSIEETALQTNLEAADEVARQCRLRDLAGLIVIDFIDMEENRNNRAVEKRMKERLKNDRARIQIGRISSFGLMEMSRQRLRPGLLEATTQVCPVCKGMGIIRSDENMALSILREVEEEAVRGKAEEINITAPVEITNFLINHKREHIAMIESRCSVALNVLGSSTMVSPDYTVERAKSPSRQPVRQTAVVTAGSVVTDADYEIEEDIEDEATDTEENQASDNDEGDRTDREGRSRRRRGKRGGRRRRSQDGTDEGGEGQNADAAPQDSEAARDEDEESSKPRRRRRKKKTATGEGEEAPEKAAEPAAADDTPQAEGDDTPRAKDDETPAPDEALPEPQDTAPPADSTVEEEVEPIPTDAAAVAGTMPSDAEVDQSETTDAAQTLETEDHVRSSEAKAEDPVTESPAEPAPELATADAGGPVEDTPKKPKRRGWWSLRG